MLQCAAGETCCNGVCLNLQSSPGNCGSCGNTVNHTLCTATRNFSDPNTTVCGRPVLLQWSLQQPELPLTPRREMDQRTLLCCLQFVPNVFAAAWHVAGIQPHCQFRAKLIQHELTRVSITFLLDGDWIFHQPVLWSMTRRSSTSKHLRSSLYSTYDIK